MQEKCSWASYILVLVLAVKRKRIVTEAELASLAKQFREAAGKTRTQAARELNVSHVSVHQAEEMPEKGLTQLRKRMIELYSPHKIVGPVFILEG